MRIENPNIRDKAHLSQSTLDKIESAVHMARRNKADGPMISHFGYDHGNGLIYSTDGKCDLLFENSAKVNRDAAWLMCALNSPTVIAELVQGYRLAVAAGLVGDKINPEVATQLSRLPVGSLVEHVNDGCRVSQILRDTLQKANREAGGVSLVPRGIA